MKGFTPLTQQQMRAFMLNKPAIQKAFNKLGRYIDYHSPGALRGGGPGTGRKMTY